MGLSGVLGRSAGMGGVGRGCRKGVGMGLLPGVGALRRIVLVIFGRDRQGVMLRLMVRNFFDTGFSCIFQNRIFAQNLQNLGGYLQNPGYYLGKFSESAIPPLPRSK